MFAKINALKVPEDTPVKKGTSLCQRKLQKNKR